MHYLYIILYLPILSFILWTRNQCVSRSVTQKWTCSKNSIPFMDKHLWMSTMRTHQWFAKHVCFSNINSWKWHVACFHRQGLKPKYAEIFAKKKKLLSSVQNPLPFHYTGWFIGVMTIHGNAKNRGAPNSTCFIHDIRPWSSGILRHPHNTSMTSSRGWLSKLVPIHQPELFSCFFVYTLWLFNIAMV